MLVNRLWDDSVQATVSWAMDTPWQSITQDREQWRALKAPSTARVMRDSDTSGGGGLFSLGGLVQTETCQGPEFPGRDGCKIALRLRFALQPLGAALAKIATGQHLSRDPYLFVGEFPSPSVKF